MASPLTLSTVGANLADAAADRWDGPGPWWPIFPALWLLVVAAIITTAVLTGRRNARRAGSRSGEGRLAERYAAGEISEQEYRERLAVLREQSR